MFFHQYPQYYFQSTDVPNLMMKSLLLLLHALMLFGLSGGAQAIDASAATTNKPVSFYKDIRPVFQAKCHGCHQPAKAKGDYIMTDFERLLAGGDSDEPAVVPKHPEKSPLIKSIKVIKGEAEMPKNKPPLHEVEIARISRWISEGAVDDTPANVRKHYSMDHPPRYTTPPVISALDWSSDGAHVAASGFHEVLIVDAKSWKRETRLVGMSERIEDLAFSPDGKRLAVAGGNPARAGEIQIWDPVKARLLLSHAVTFDTLYGVSWSPKSNAVAFGCSDHSVRAIDVKNGDQMFYNASHNDWALDTAWSHNGELLVSVGRDMSVKAYKLATERFIDNITSITPGALKGGINAVVVHPLRDEVLVAGADGTPKLYRTRRVKKREIGDDSNLLLEFQKIPGRAFDIEFSSDGSTVVAVSSLNNRGTVAVYNLPPTWETPGDVNGILLKPVFKRNEAERKKLADFFAATVKLKSRIDHPAALYATALSPDGKRAVFGGGDGKIHLLNLESGRVEKSVMPVELDSAKGKTN